MLLLNTVHTYSVLLLSQGQGPRCLIIDSHSWSNHKSFTLIFCLLLCYRHYDRIHVSVIFTVQLFHLLSHHGFYFVFIFVMPTNLITVSNELQVQMSYDQRLFVMATYFLSASYLFIFRDVATSRYHFHFDFAQNHLVAGLIIVSAHNIKGSVFIHFMTNETVTLLIPWLSSICIRYRKISVVHYTASFEHMSLSLSQLVLHTHTRLVNSVSFVFHMLHIVVLVRSDNPGYDSRNTKKNIVIKRRPHYLY